MNTLVLRADGTRYGENTDVPGFVGALRERGGDRRRRARAVLGGGATAGSALAALSSLVKVGPVAVLRGRNPAKLAEFDALLGHFGLQIEPRPWSGRRARRRARSSSSTPPRRARPSGALAELLPPGPDTAVFDVVYHPWPTPLARAAAAAGTVVPGGLDLLLHQAAAQVELMTGKPAPLEAMRAAGQAAVLLTAPRANRAPR